MQGVFGLGRHATCLAQILSLCVQGGLRAYRSDLRGLPRGPQSLHALGLLLTGGAELGLLGTVRLQLFGVSRELRVALGELLRRLPDMAYDGSGPEIVPHSLVRACVRMPVRFTPETAL